MVVQAAVSSQARLRLGGEAELLNDRGALIALSLSDKANRCLLTGAGEEVPSAFD